MNDFLAIFMLSLLWFLMVSLQSRMLNHEATRISLFIVAFTASVIWVTLVRKVVVGDDIMGIIAYSLGSALGVVVAKELHVRWGDDM